MSFLKVLSVGNAVKATTKASLFIRRNRPIIETGLGLITIGVSVKLAFDAKGKVDAITTSKNVLLMAKKLRHQKLYCV